MPIRWLADGMTGSFVYACGETMAERIMLFLSAVCNVLLPDRII